MAGGKGREEMSTEIYFSRIYLISLSMSEEKIAESIDTINTDYHDGKCDFLDGLESIRNGLDVTKYYVMQREEHILIILPPQFNGRLTWV